MQRRLGSVMGIGRKIGINDDKGIIIAVFLALIVVSSIVAGYYIILRPQPEPYNTINLLNENKQATDYPEVLVSNQNSTFSVYVEVANHMNTDESYRVQTKITKNLPATFPEGLQVDPVDVYDFSLPSGASNQNLVTVTEKEVGSHSVVFELWRLDSGNYVFTQNYCVLKIQVI